jgi:hypothetical protein
MNQAIPMTIRRHSCATFQTGASHTKKQAGNLPDSEVFSRSEFVDLSLLTSHGFGAGSAYPQGRQHNLFCVTTPSSTFCPSQASGGFQFNKELEIMIKVTTSTADKIARQQAIENALNTALFHIRQPSTSTALFAATGRASRALTMLKQACADAQIGGAA